MRTHPSSGAASLAAVCTGFLLVVAVPVALAADVSDLRTQAAGLRAHTGSLDMRAKAATLELYALETRLGRAQRELETLRSRRAALARDQASTRTQLAIAKRVLTSSQAELAQLVRAIYQQSGSDPLAVVLGARSLEEALAGLDGLSRAAGQTNRIIAQAGTARRRLAKLDARLASRAAALSQLAAAAEARAASLAATASARRGFIAGLRRQQGLNEARIASIEQQARAAEARTAAVAVAAPPPALSPVEVMAPPSSVSGPRTLTVSSTGYALRGRTATGVPTAPGVVAVDPAVIPLGTRMTIPGYGVGVAADTGGAVQGYRIDLWFPTTAQALAWGQRSVTITLGE